MVTADVCPRSGKGGPSCTDRAAAKFARGRTPEQTCDVHVRAVASAAPRAGEPGVHRCDHSGRVVAMLPAVYDGWLAALPPRRTGAGPGRHAVEPFRARVPATPGDHEVVVHPADERLAIRVGRSRFSVR